MREWVRLSYHVPISYQEYIELPRVHRYMMHKELIDWIDVINDENEGAGITPRSERKGGF